MSTLPQLPLVHSEPQGTDLLLPSDKRKKLAKRTADKYEGCGNRRYVEIEFALPNELTSIEQYLQIIDAFIAKHLNAHSFISQLRIDQRSLKAQRDAVESNGDSFLAKLFDRLPEEYFGIVASQDDPCPLFAQFELRDAIVNKTCLYQEKGNLQN